MTLKTKRKRRRRRSKIKTDYGRLGFTSYRAYLNSDLWKQKRAEFIASDWVKKDARGKPICDLCGGWRLIEIHHLRYDRLGAEPFHDLQALCRVCHRRLHH